MKSLRLKKFSPEIMELYLQQHFLLKDKIKSSNQKKMKELQFKILRVFSELHNKMLESNPHVRVIVGLGGNFKEGRESYIMKYSVFCRRKDLFEFPNNLVSFIPPNFENFMDFAHYANNFKNEN